MKQSHFYVVSFIDTYGAQQLSRTYSTIRMARKLAKHISTFGLNVRIMKGGPGGMQVS